MTSRRPSAARRRAAARGPSAPARTAPRARWRWPLALACLALAGAGAYWLQAQPAPGPSERAAAPDSARSQRARNEAGQVEARRAPGQLPAEVRARPRTQAQPAAADDYAEAPPPSEASSSMEPHATSEPERLAPTHAASTAVPPPEAAEAPTEESSERPPRPRPRARRLELAVLRRWNQPGLCMRAEQASEAQRTLMRHFRAAELGTGARVFLDPRLPAGAEQPALEHLEEAQRILRAELQLSPGLPDLFLYSDVQLLLASACTNADVVAYYDGALHIVVTRDDVRESVLHEFTHHALMSAGVLGPAWLQEGMAMHIARETWWRRPELLQQLIERPFGLSTMETIVPYTLESEHAVLFYAQSAAMVECATREPDSTLSGLLSELDVQQSADTLEYGLPAPAELSALRECLRELLQDPQQP